MAMSDGFQENSISEFTVLTNKLSACSPATKAYAVQILLLSKLKTLNAGEILNFVEDLQNKGIEKFSELDCSVDTFKLDPEKILQRVQQKLEALSGILNTNNSRAEDIYQQFDILLEKAQRQQAEIIDIAGLSSSEEQTTELALIKIKQNEKQHLNATYATSETITSRIINSLNPESFEKYLDTGLIKVGPLRKAAMFDALNEKYTQVKSYQEEGKMLRDFKVLYKQELKKQKKAD